MQNSWSKAQSQLELSLAQLSPSLFSLLSKHHSKRPCTYCGIKPYKMWQDLVFSVKLQFSLASLESLKFRSSIFSLQRSSFIEFHFGLEKNMGSEKILVRKNLGPKINVGSEKNIGSEEKKFGSEKNVGSVKKVGCEKKVGSATAAKIKRIWNGESKEKLCIINFSQKIPDKDIGFQNMPFLYPKMFNFGLLPSSAQAPAKLGWVAIFSANPTNPTHPHPPHPPGKVYFSAGANLVSKVEQSR